MIIIGLTGGIASGKSEAVKFLASQGLPVFDSDAEVHKLYASKAGADLIRPYAPEAVIGDKVDRTILSRAIRNDPTLLSHIETKVHQEIKSRRINFMAQAHEQNQRAVVFDIPLLFETGADAEVDHTIVISANPETQHARAMQRPGMSQEKYDMILARQMPDAQKRARAEVVIENNGTIDELHSKLAATLKHWKLNAT